MIDRDFNFQNFEIHISHVSFMAALSKDKISRGNLNLNDEKEWMNVINFRMDEKCENLSH